MRVNHVLTFGMLDTSRIVTPFNALWSHNVAKIVIMLPTFHTLQSTLYTLHTTVHTLQSTPYTLHSQATQSTLYCRPYSKGYVSYIFTTILHFH